MTEAPHAILDSVIYKDNRFLRKRDKSADKIIYNQSAGHLKPAKYFITDAERESPKKTDWKIKVFSFLGICQYTLPYDEIHYERYCFVAKPIAMIDSDILDACWLTREEIISLSSDLRSPIVFKMLLDFIRASFYPLSIIRRDNGDDNFTQI